MDYHALANELPKQPIKWSVSDVEIWLKFIGLSSLYSKFRDLSIDGSCITSLTEQDLKDELNIKSSIIIKKIMSWITKGLSEYTVFLRGQDAGAEEAPQLMSDITQKPKMNQFLQQNVEDPKSIFKHSTSKNISNGLSQIPNSLKDIEKENNKVETESMIDEDEENKKKEFQLIIQQCDGPQTSFFSVKEEGAKIGRHSSNQILVLDESISRYHAEIKFESGIFFLRDTGSTTGTFLKILEKKQIYHGMILQMGSNQFLAHLNGTSLSLEIIQGPSQGPLIDIPKTGKISIGRKANNLINFPDDQHLSNIHSTIFSIQNKYYIEDMGTTNGTWERLSLEGESSEPFEIYDKTVFKIGGNQTYLCKIKMALVTQKTHPNACIICYENDKDCVYMPCKHNTACIKCSKNLRQCPICRVKIEDFVRIYKS